VPLIFFAGSLKISVHGAILAALSGAVASGVGYAVWYAVLKYHSATRAAVLQLSVPAIAAVGGIVFLAEAFTPRFAIASVLILGGIAMTIFGRRR
ncbi:MAG TPA: DMT family transporter, partial [Pyrinomonadaceae bacterium]|nr:DMT family transporter [Pyrinomonadaceae bacterium]